MLDLEPFFDDERLDTVLSGLYEHNVKPFAYCMANETGEGIRNEESWPYYGELFFAAPAIMAGKVEQAMDMEERFAKAMDKAGLHWDLPLKWDGPDMGNPRWGRWYMSTPASWSILQALAGVFYDGLTHTLTIRPRRWSHIGEHKDLPIFHPLFWGRISTTADGWELHIDRLRKQKIHIREVLVDGPLSLTWRDTLLTSTPIEDDHKRLAVDYCLDAPGAAWRRRE